MPSCYTCSAPLPAKSHTCEYCGHRNDVDLQGIHQYTEVQPETPRHCPRCQEEMQTLDLGLDGRFLIERCRSCLGLFFDNGELAALLDGTVKNVFQIDHQRLANIGKELGRIDSEIRYAKCPVCNQLMHRVNYGRKSGVVVDRCANHGVWLDGGELRTLMEWRKAGGQLFHEQVMSRKQQEEDKQKKRRQTQRRKIVEQASATSGGTRHQMSYSETNDADLFGSFFSLIDRLFR